MEAIRAMLYASGTARKDAGPIASSRQLKQHHRQIMATLSKLVLAAKTASGVWPPPDAVAKMQQAANDVLLAVRQFVAAAQEAGVEIRSPGHTPTEESTQSSGALSSSSDVQNNPVSPPVPPMSPKRGLNSARSLPSTNNGNASNNVQNNSESIQQHTSDTELIASLEKYTRSVMRMIANLTQAVRSGKCNSQQLIGQVRSIVTEVGNFLSLVDELPLD